MLWTWFKCTGQLKINCWCLGSKAFSSSWWCQIDLGWLVWFRSGLVHRPLSHGLLPSSYRQQLAARLLLPRRASPLEDRPVKWWNYYLPDSNHRSFISFAGDWVLPSKFGLTITCIFATAQIPSPNLVFWSPRRWGRRLKVSARRWVRSLRRAWTLHLLAGGFDPPFWTCSDSWTIPCSRYSCFAGVRYVLFNLFRFFLSIR